MSRTSRPSPLGQQNFYWAGVHPFYGPIRQFLEELEVSLADEVYLVFGDDGSFPIETVVGLIGEPFHDSLALIGAPRSLSAEVASRVLAATTVRS